ncbi:hypothetical protein RFL04_00775 [Streptococcus suis]|uniref:hypothetical protein n=1 Tax=Streptococcus suis TaxID=1307 RepID=UPI002FCB52F9
MQSKSQQFVFYTPNLTITTVANKVRSISNLKLSPRPFELCGGGVKQSGDRLFQLNNWKQGLVDELFFTFRVLSHSQAEANELRATIDLSLAFLFVASLSDIK